MAAPQYGSPPSIRQEGASLVVYDNAGWFAQGGEHATRYVHVWYWNGANVWSTPAPPWRSRPEDIQPGENMVRIPLGPTNVGGMFYVREYGGVESPAFGNEPAWTEWGREWSGNPSDATRWGAKSNLVEVVAWSAPDPPPPPTDTPELLLRNARDGVRPLISHLRTQGLTWAQVKAHKYGHAYYTDLEGK